MEIHEIRYFLAVCRTLNFTKAAEQCNVSQPALTRAIQKIEGELGGLLFSRERSNTHLTELGRLMQPHLEEVMARTQAARETASRFLRLESAHLRVGVMCTISPMRFVGFLNRFRADHTGIELTLSEAVPPRLAEALLRGDIDVAVMAQPEAYDEKLRPEALYRERFVLACPAGHPFARRNIIAMRDMDGQVYLQRINCEFRDELRERCELAGAQILRSYRSEREDWIQTMVAAGMGVCLSRNSPRPIRASSCAASRNRKWCARSASSPWQVVAGRCLWRVSSRRSAVTTGRRPMMLPMSPAVPTATPRQPSAADAPRCAGCIEPMRQRPWPGTAASSDTPSTA